MWGWWLLKVAKYTGSSFWCSLRVAIAEETLRRLKAEAPLGYSRKTLIRKTSEPFLITTKYTPEAKAVRSRAVPVEL